MKVLLKQTAFCYENPEEGQEQVIEIAHKSGSATHNPDLLNFANYAEDILHKMGWHNEAMLLRVEIEGQKGFRCVTRNEGHARMVLLYFNGGKYKVDMGYDETEGDYFVIGVFNGERQRF